MLQRFQTESSDYPRQDFGYQSIYVALSRVFIFATHEISEALRFPETAVVFSRPSQ
jgi:ABC-type proline/glycine betaine transport system ATPase subunit